ncbi:MAG: ABC transporter ATP-binding protein [Chloroflexota bacterium]
MGITETAPTVAPHTVDLDPPLLLDVRRLHQYFKSAGSREPKRAVDGVSFSLRRDEILGVVGESGSGKSTIARSVVGLNRPSSGEVLFAGVPLPPTSRRRSREQKRRLQMVFQNPAAALNPRRTIGQALALPLRIHRRLRGQAARREIERLLELVELPREFAGRYPAALSGGQRQRVAIARALAAEPDLLILDEPTSALDVSVQAKMIDLLLELKGRLGLSYLFITHDISLVRTIADRVVVLYQGRVRETGPIGTVFAEPRHPYTQLLISAVPVITEEEEALQPRVPSVVPGAGRPTPEPDVGCAFAPRCPYVMDQCWVRPPPLYRGAGVDVRCFLEEKLGSRIVEEGE